MRGFIDDLSTWYVRRSRDRVKGSDVEDKQMALRTLRYVLTEFAKCIAPVMPFIAEEIYQETKATGAETFESVHLCEWPRVGKSNESLTIEMQQLRSVASEALMLRQKSGIKVRQPLARLFIREAFSTELADILRAEVNVKEVVSGAAEVSLDTTLTPELISEGDLREFMRALADARKEKGFTQKDMVAIVVEEVARTILQGVVLPGISASTFVPHLDAASDTHTAILSIGTVQFSLLSEVPTTGEALGNSNAS
jgi:isoleucyl-tRNA synthetase